MKQKLLFGIVMLLGMMMNVQQGHAQSWTASAPANGTFYLYNVGAEKFMTSGTTYGSRASVDPHAAMPMGLTRINDGYYLSSAAIYETRYLGSDGYLDNGKAAVWVFEAVSGQANTYTLKVSGTSNYLYWDGAGTYTLSVGANTNNNRSWWKLATKDNLSQDLRNASTDNPMNATFFIQNSWFAKGNGIEAHKVVPKHWEGTVVTDYWGYQYDKGSLDDCFCVEQYDKTFDNYQILTVPNGEYILSAQGFYRGTTAPLFYANNSTDPFVAIDQDGPETKPNNIATAATALRFENGWYEVGNIKTKVTNGTLRIGAKCLSAKVDWCAFDNFSLVCTGIYFSADAQPLPSTTLTPDQWYYYNVPSKGTYELNGDLEGLVYTTNGAQKLGSVSYNSASPTLVINANRIYFKTNNEGTTLSLTKTSESLSNTFTICALNVDGLPAKILTYDVNPEGPGTEGTKLISKYLAEKGYDIIGVSEDFNHHGSLESELGESYNQGTHRGALDFSAYGGAILNKLKVDTDGLGLFYKKQHSADGEKWQSWTQSYGNLSNEFDENVDKGYRYYKITLADGTIFDLYILHMDAGSAVGDWNARQSQLTQMAEVIKNNTNGRPKIVMGDTNCRYTRDQVQELFINPIVNSSNYTVTDAWVNRQNSDTYPTYQYPYDESGNYDWSRDLDTEVVDKIFIINPKSGLQFTLEDFYVADDYVDENNNQLGDHRPIVARLSTAGVQILPEEEQDFWEGEPETAVGTQRYFYNVGIRYYMNSDNSNRAVQSINQASLWNINNGDSKTVTLQSNSNSIKQKGGWGSSYYFEFNTSTGAAHFTVSASTTTNGAFKFKCDRWLSMNYDQAVDVVAKQTADNTNDWLLISQKQKDAYNNYVDAFNEANAYANYTLPNNLYTDLVNALSAEVKYSTSKQATDNLQNVVTNIKNYLATYNPVEDCTELIKNPSFEKKNSVDDLGATENGPAKSVYGWTVQSNDEAFAPYETADNTHGRYFTNMDGNHFFNAWTNGGEGTFSVKQTITIEEDGYYELSAIVASGGGDEGDTYATLVFGSTKQSTGTLNDRTVGVRVAIVSYCSAGESYEIGIESTKWFKADDFQLHRMSNYYNVTIGSTNYASICLPRNTEVPAGVDIFYVTSINNSDPNPDLHNVHMEQYDGQVIPGNQGFILYSEQPSTYRFHYTTEDPEALAKTNLLSGTTERISNSTIKADTDNTYYVLANKSKGVGFYKIGTANIPAQKAYMKVANTAGVKASAQYLFSFIDDTPTTPTAIETVEKSDTNTIVVGIYSLDGKRQAQMVRGMNIVRMSDGSVKKILVK